MAKKDDSIVGSMENINEYLAGAAHPKLGERDKEDCDSPLMIIELDKSLMNLNNDSAPGLDGIPVSFYKVFWNILKQPLFESIKYSLTIGELSTTQKSGIITLQSVFF